MKVCFLDLTVAVHAATEFAWLRIQNRNEVSAGKSIAAHCLSPKIVHSACWGKLAASVQVAAAAKAAAAAAGGGGRRPRAMTLKQMSKVRGQSQIALSSAVPLRPSAAIQLRVQRSFKHFRLPVISSVLFS